jgi:hypothetical protein
MARKAKEMAALLIDLYLPGNTPFILTQTEFDALAGKGKMRKKFLLAIDTVLRKRGYILLDAHKESEMVGVVSVDTMAHWAIPPMPEEPQDPPGADLEDAQETDSAPEEVHVRYPVGEAEWQQPRIEDERSAGTV